MPLRKNEKVNMETTIKFFWAKDIEPHFNYFLPSFLKILQPSVKQKRIIEKKYNERHCLSLESIHSMGLFEAEATIFDLLWQAKEGEAGSIAFLQFIDLVCSSLIEKLKSEFLLKLRNTCFSAIVNFGNLQSRYLCSIGELALLEKILTSSENNLIEVEYKLPNGKSFDFAIMNNSKLSIIEITNIFLDTTLIDSEEDFDSFLNYRFNKKLNDKFKNLSEDEKYSFGLLPLLWGNIPKLAKYYPYIRNFKAPNDIVLPFMTIFPVTNSETNKDRYFLLDIKQFLEVITRKEKTILNGY